MNTVATTKNPVIALLLNLFLGGGGYIYIGQTAKGVVAFLTALLLLPLGIGFLIPIFTCIDGYKLAQKINDGRSIGNWEYFWNKTTQTALPLSSQLMELPLLAPAQEGNAKIMDANVIVYNAARDRSLPVYRVDPGTSIKIAGLTTNYGKQWVQITLPNGTLGYIPGNTRVFQIRKAKLLQDEAMTYTEPSAVAPMGTLKKGDKFHILDANLKQHDREWVKIRDTLSRELYIDGKTKVRVIQENRSEVGKKNMGYGVLWFIGGVIVTAISYSSAANSPAGGTYYIFGGAIFWGAIQFLNGLYQYITGVLWHE